MKVVEAAERCMSQGGSKAIVAFGIGGDELSVAAAGISGSVRARLERLDCTV